MRYLEGEVNIEAFRAFTERQKRMLEWWYLKEYWRASAEDKPIVLALYGKPLREAIERYNRRFKHQTNS